MKTICWKLRAGHLIPFLFCLLLLTGCGRTQPISYYQLTSLEDSQHAFVSPVTTATVVIGIGPVSLPDYLDRPQLVTRLTPNQLQLSDRHRWAEPLSQNIPRVLGENLSRLLGTSRILLFPWPSANKPDYQLLVELLNFENENDGTAYLVARWTLKDQEGTIVLPERQSRLRIVAWNQEQEGLVTALNEVLERFCREIVLAMQPLINKAPR